MTIDEDPELTAEELAELKQQEKDILSGKIQGIPFEKVLEGADRERLRKLLEERIDPEEVKKRWPKLYEPPPITKEEMAALWVLIAQTMKPFVGEPNVQETRDRMEKAVAKVLADFYRTLADEQRRQGLKELVAEDAEKFGPAGGLNEADVMCACGQSLHYSSISKKMYVEGLIVERGETVIVTTPDGSWWVPRHYIALHGIKAAEMPALAEKYGFKRKN